METENLQNSRVERIRNKLNEKPSVILEHFGVKYVNKGNYLKSNCPCHESDNEIGFTVWTEQDYNVWNCHTKSCQEDYGYDLIGLVRGILSFRQGKKAYFRDVLDYCEANIGIADAEPADCEFTKLCSSLNKVKESPTIIGPKSSINELNIPSNYYRSKGFSEEILRRFSIGDCTNPQKPMFNRAVCPILSEDGESLIGAAGRRILDKDYLQKWKYSYKFKSGSYLYGLWLAKPKILRFSRVILVEGMMDVAKLHEMGYDETVGLFGVNVTNNHLDILNRLGVMRVDLMLDGDESGEQASNRNYEKLKNYFNVKVHLLPAGKDPDELTREELKTFLGDIND